jgi:hypothetical protein
MPKMLNLSEYQRDSLAYVAPLALGIAGIGVGMYLFFYPEILIWLLG